MRNSQFSYVQFTALLNYVVVLGDTEISPLLCMEPSLEMITKKQLIFAFGAYQTHKYNKSTKYFPELTKFLQTQSNKLDLRIQKQGNSTETFNRIRKIIDTLNEKVGLVILADAARTPKRSPQNVPQAPFYKRSPTCSKNKNSSFDSMLILNFVSTLFREILLQVKSIVKPKL